MLQAQLHQWLDGLPESLRFTRSAIHQRKETSQLGALLLCHFTYHHTMCKLTAVWIGEHVLTHVQSEYVLQKALFLITVQNQCFEQNMALCALFDEACNHGTEALTDTWLSIVAHDSARWLVNYIGKGPEEVMAVRSIDGIGSNIRALKRMIPIHAQAQPLVRVARPASQFL